MHGYLSQKIKEDTMVTELKQSAQQSQEDEPPQAPQSEAAQAEQPAGAGPLLGSALQEQMAQARQVGPPQEGEEAAQSSLQAVVQGAATSSQQTVQWLSNTLSALLQTVRSMVQAVGSAL